MTYVLQKNMMKKLTRRDKKRCWISKEMYSNNKNWVLVESWVEIRTLE